MFIAIKLICCNIHYITNNKETTMAIDLKLVDYMKLKKLTVPEMATELGRTRQNVDQWIAKDAMVEILANGQLEITTLNVVHEPQVRSK